MRELCPVRGRGLSFVMLAALAVGACSAGRMHSAAMPSMAMAAEVAAPPPLERSLFARDPNGQLSEDALQAIIEAPIELDLPARVGVLPVITATDWRGPNPDYQEAVPAGVNTFVKRLRGSEPFSLVTEMMPIPSGALGMEALREIAARYRLRYVILYREVIEKRNRVNAFAAGYATLVGALFVRGQDFKVQGYMEASLFDVKTGVLLFTTRRGVTAEKAGNLWHNDEKLAKLHAEVTRKFGPDLADDVKQDLYRYADAAKIEDARRQRHAAAPVVPAVATH